MSKVKVYELAKELGKDSKDVVKFLEGKNIEVKNHMSTISEDEAAMVKKALGGSKAHASEDEAKAAPKKKNIVHVFRPQNTRDGSRNGRRQAGVLPVEQRHRRMQSRCRYRTEDRHREASRQ